MDGCHPEDLRSDLSTSAKFLPQAHIVGLGKILHCYRHKQDSSSVARQLGTTNVQDNDFLGALRDEAY